jgi:hypothetical protein
MTGPVKAEPDVAALLADMQKAGSLSDAKFTALLSLMMAKEARIAEKEAALEVTLQARDAQRRRDSENYTISKIEAQKACRHLKGGKGRSRGQQKDPSVYLHTFTNSDRVIKCQLCSARWLPGDTTEYLTRNGSKIPNWTHIGWPEAFEMCADSSNKASASERFGNAPQGEMPKTDKGAIPSNLQI